jgi:signal peptidase I
MVNSFKMTKQPDFFDRFQSVAEAFLTWRRRVRHAKREKQKAKNPVLDWVEAFIWAAGMVLLANQYVIQAYVIPSGSMIDTLNIGDRIFVNKLIFGPELLPGLVKLPSPVKPMRNNIIIFENPAYLSRGPVFDVAQRIIYMLTISLVDIDKDELGRPKAHFLIKRAIGTGGDHLIMERGEIKMRFAGETRWVDERENNARHGWKHRLRRVVEQENYPAMHIWGKIEAWQAMGLPVPEYLQAELSQTDNIRALDRLAIGKARVETLRNAMPYDSRYASMAARSSLGWYIPEGRIFPLGDNRDESQDGRIFGPVQLSKVLGRGASIHWPIKRIGPIK